MDVFILFITELVFILISTVKIKLVAKSSYASMWLTACTTILMGTAFIKMIQIQKETPTLAVIIMTISATIGCGIGIWVIRKIEK